MIDIGELIEEAFSAYDEGLMPPDCLKAHLISICVPWFEIIKGIEKAKRETAIYQERESCAQLVAKSDEELAQAIRKRA